VLAWDTREELAAFAYFSARAKLAFSVLISLWLSPLVRGLRRTGALGAFEGSCPDAVASLYCAIYSCNRIELLPPDLLFSLPMP